MINEHFWVLPTGTSYSMNYVLNSVKVPGFSQKYRAAKLLSTWQLTFFPGSWFGYPNCIHPLPLFPLVMFIYSQKYPFLIKWRKKNSCQGPKPESPVHFKKCTWKAVNRNVEKYFEFMKFSKLTELIAKWHSVLYGQIISKIFQITVVDQF